MRCDGNIDGNTGFVFATNLHDTCDNETGESTHGRTTLSTYWRLLIQIHIAHEYFISADNAMTGSKISLSAFSLKHAIGLYSVIGNKVRLAFVIYLTKCLMVKLIAFVLQEGTLITDARKSPPHDNIKLTY